MTKSSFIKNTGLALLVSIGLSFPAYSAENNTSNKPVISSTNYNRLEQLTQEDRELFSEKGSETQTQEYNQLGKEYVDILFRKGKYDPRTKQLLKETINTAGLYSYDVAKQKYTKLSQIEKLKRQILRENDPEKYLEMYVQDKAEQEKIKNMPTEESKKESINAWKVTNDLSDKIFNYEFNRMLKDSLIVPGLFTPMSGNPLVR